MATVHLPNSLVGLFPGAPRCLAVEATSVGDLIDHLNERWPGLRNRLCDAGPTLRAYIIVFVDGEKATLATPLQPTSDVHVVPAVAGG